MQKKNNFWQNDSFVNLAIFPVCLFCFSLDKLFFKDFRMLYIIREGLYRWIFCSKSYQVTVLELLRYSTTKTRYLPNDSSRRRLTTRVVDGSER